MNSRHSFSQRAVGRLHRAVGRPLTWVGDIAGYDVVRRDYYSPIPDLRHLSDSIWSTPSALTGVNLDLDNQIRFVEQDLAPYLTEFAPPLDADPTKADRFFLRNGTYESVDADMLYAMVRLLKPGRVIELGSGRSTQVISLALSMNESEGVNSTYRVIDPYPEPWLQPSVADSIQIDEISATDVPLSDFASLSAGDILFVDTTHTVKLASDVNYILLEVLPTLAQGVTVHFHDVFLPWSYPREWLVDSRWFWAEQWLLQGFLAFNSVFTVLLSCYALAQRYPDRLHNAIPSFSTGVKPGAFWIRRAH